MSLNNKYLNFVASPGGSNPPAQMVTLGTNEHPYQWTAAVDTRNTGTWLNVTPKSGSLAGDFERMNLIVTLTSSSLTAGVYSGTITIAATTLVDNSPQVIQVALNVTTTGQAAPGLSLFPAVVSLEGVRGSGRTYSNNIQVNNAGGGSLNWTSAATTDNGGSWLSVTPQSGVNGGSVTVTAAVGNLNLGTYTGSVAFNAPGAAFASQSVRVSFRVREPLPPSIFLNSPSLSFTGQPGAPNPPSQNLVISNGGEGTLAWQMTATTFNGGPWLSATPPSGTGFGVVIASVVVGDLTPGTYAGRITISADGVSNAPVQVPVTLTVRRAQPVFDRRGVVSAATFVATPVAPGQIISIFGSRLGPEPGVTFTLEPGSQKLPETLAGTRITFGGVPAPLFFVSYSQVNLQVPFEVARDTSSRIVVSVEGIDPAETSVEVADAVPGVFTVDGTRAAALNQDSTVNGPENPAPIGSVVQLFLTGQGALDIAVPTGVLAPAAPPFPRPLLPVSVNMDGFESRILFAGLAPGFAGLMQVNAEVPRGVTPSDRVRVSVAVGFNQAVKPVTIAVR